jgi:hypothetical protein
MVADTFSRLDEPDFAKMPNAEENGLFEDFYYKNN